MSSIAIWLSKAWLALSLAVTGAASSLPVAGQALGSNPPAAPASARPFDHRLERVWSRQQDAYERQTEFFDRVDGRIANAQQLIDRAKANGKDVSGLQQALDAFKAAVDQARPIYDSTGALVAAHSGFDDKGKLMDQQQALQTVISVSDKLQQVRALVQPAAWALRQAVWAFRLANPGTPVPSPAPTP